MSTTNPQTSPKPSLLPSPFARNSPGPQPIQATSASIYSPEPEHSTSAYPPPEQDEAQEGHLLPPSFNPLFTLISDAQTGEFHHPSTYYVFADDESAADTVSTAALHSLDTYVHDPLSERAREQELDIEERYVVLDFTTDGAGIASAQSLAPGWAVTGARVAAAPMFGGAESDNTGMMVVVEGVSSSQSSKGQGHDRQEASRGKVLFDEAKGKCGGSLTSAMSEILASVNKGTDLLEKVVGIEDEVG